MEFREYAQQPDERLDLLLGALLLARDHYPELDVTEQSARIDALAAPLAKRGLERESPAFQARALSDHLYIESGFHGAAKARYYDPRNSFVNEVLERRVGIPISLAVVYMEVARRVGVSARGVGFPGHFLVKVGEGERAIFIDPFSTGGILGFADLEALLARANVKKPLTEAMLAPTPTRHVLARMLVNLRGIYSSQGDSARLLLVLDRLLDLMPELTEELRDRGRLYAKLGAPVAARADLERYLEKLPHASDAGAVRSELAALGKPRAN